MHEWVFYVRFQCGVLCQLWAFDLFAFFASLFGQRHVVVQRPIPRPALHTPTILSHRLVAPLLQSPEGSCNDLCPRFWQINRMTEEGPLRRLNAAIRFTPEPLSAASLPHDAQYTAHAHRPHIVSDIVYTPYVQESRSACTALGDFRHILSTSSDGGGRCPPRRAPLSYPVHYPPQAVASRNAKQEFAGDVEQCLESRKGAVANEPETDGSPYFSLFFCLSRYLGTFAHL
jgi:hypothetical protein